MRAPTRRAIAFLILMTASITTEADELRVGLMHGIGMPYDLGGERGLAWDIVRRLADELEADGFSIVRLPRNRIYRMLASGALDVVLPSNPAWLSESTDVDWTVSLFVVSDRVYALKGAARGFSSLEALSGKRIGTILGYIYPETWMRAFERRAIVREDVVTLEQNLGKLEAGRIDGFIAEDTIMSYLLRSSPGLAARVDAAPLLVERYSIHIAVSRQGQFSVERLDAAIEGIDAQSLAGSYMY